MALAECVRCAPLSGPPKKRSEELMRKATNISREKLYMIGTCFGKFTKTMKFRLHITALEYLAPYAKVAPRLSRCSSWRKRQTQPALSSTVQDMAEAERRNVVHVRQPRAQVASWPDHRRHARAPRRGRIYHERHSHRTLALRSRAFLAQALNSLIPPFFAGLWS